MTLPIDPTRVISGNYGYVYDENGTWLANVTAFSAELNITVEDVERAGTRRVGKKTMSTDGSGSMSANKVSSYFIQRVMSAAQDNSPAFITELNVKIDDPESRGTERWRIKGVQFETVPMVNFEVGSIMTEEYTFSFETAELVQAIN